MLAVRRYDVKDHRRVLHVNTWKGGSLGWMMPVHFPPVRLPMRRPHSVIGEPRQLLKADAI
jgi:hypothetical protein